MQFSIAFQTSGDTVEFNTVSDAMFEFIEWYVDQLNINNANSFVCQDDNNIIAEVQLLHDTLTEINSFIIPFLDEKFDTKLELEDYTNNHLLNKLHAVWAVGHNAIYDKKIKKIQYANTEHQNIIDQIEQYGSDSPTVNELLHHFQFLKRYSDLNLSVHAIEHCYRIINYESEHLVLMTNPFSSELLTNHYTNFSIRFGHLGRCLYDKFLAGDLTLIEPDENNFQTIFSSVAIGMQTPESVPLSPEYINWCQLHDRVPSGAKLAIGNVVDYTENNIQIRKLLYRNLNDKFLIITT